MEITYNSQNFPRHYGPSLRGSNRITFSPQELFWSAITVGRANVIDVISNGIYSEYEILYRSSIVAANIAQNGNNLIKSSAYQSLNPSEKSAVSYFLGLTFCKLLSHRLLNVPWLLHIDVYRSHFRATGQAFRFGSSRLRPDMIGLDNRRRWVVMESKGRTNTFAPNLLAHGKSQTRNLRQIGGSYPNLRVAAVTHFTNNFLTVDWEDPEGVNEENFDLETSLGDYLFYYYKLIVNILSNNETRRVSGYTVYTFQNVNLTIGLETSIFNAYRNRSLENVQRQQIVPSVKFQEFPEQDFYAGADGIIVGLGQNWRDLIRTNEK
ncbi:hypothetical protein [Ferruginibacter sp.]